MLKELILISKKEVTKDMAVFTFKAPKLDFKPGQWITISSKINNKEIPRAYSIASAPYQLPKLELFIKHVIKDKGQGIFTSKLFKSKKNSKFKILRIGGKFLVDPNDKRTKILLASGTGLAPYISIIRDEIKKCNKSNSIVIHGASYVKDLAYKEELERYEKENKIVKYISTISRPEENKNWKGTTGRVEEIAKFKLNKILNGNITKDKYAIYLCGHPGMIDNISEFYKKKGFEENKDLKFERYWSEPKK